MNKLNKLQVWNKSIELAKDIYLLTKKFPKEETYGMTSQLQRCSSSIPANISEGAGRNSNKEFLYFLSIANGSAYELETFLVLAFKVGYINEKIKDELLSRNHHIIKMNVRLQDAIRRNL